MSKSGSATPRHGLRRDDATPGGDESEIVMAANFPDGGGHFRREAGGNVEEGAVVPFKREQPFAECAIQRASNFLQTRSRSRRASSKSSGCDVVGIARDHTLDGENREGVVMAYHLGVLDRHRSFDSLRDPRQRLPAPSGNELVGDAASSAADRVAAPLGPRRVTPWSRGILRWCAVPHKRRAVFESG